MVFVMAISVRVHMYKFMACLQGQWHWRIWVSRVPLFCNAFESWTQAFLEGKIKTKQHDPQHCLQHYHPTNYHVSTPYFILQSWSSEQSGKDAIWLHKCSNILPDLRKAVMLLKISFLLNYMYWKIYLSFT